MSNKNRTSSVRLGIVFVLVLTMLSWGVLIVLCGEDPFSTFYYILVGAFKNSDKIYSVVNKLFIFFFTALAYSIPSWSGMFNVGGDGQLVFGAFAAASIPLIINTEVQSLNVFICLFAAIVVGGLWALWPAVLRVKFGINEVVTTLLSTYLIQYFTEYTVSFPLRAVNASVPRMEYIPGNFRFFTFGNTTLSASVLVVLFVLVAVELFRARSIAGFQLRMTGSNLFLARTAGINTNRMRIGSMISGGALAGLAGGLLVLTTNYTYMSNFSPGYGMNGMLIALISGSLPSIALVITLLFSILQVGAINMQVFTSIPSEITGVLQSLMVFFVASRESLGIATNLIKRRPPKQQSSDVRESISGTKR